MQKLLPSQIIVDQQSWCGFKGSDRQGSSCWQNKPTEMTYVVIKTYRMKFISLQSLTLLFYLPAIQHLDQLVQYQKACNQNFTILTIKSQCLHVGSYMLPSSIPRALLKPQLNVQPDKKCLRSSNKPKNLLQLTKHLSWDTRFAARAQINENGI